MNEQLSGQPLDQRTAPDLVLPLPPKGQRRTEAEAALRGVDRIIFGDVDRGHEVWMRSYYRPEHWYKSSKAGDEWLTSDELYRRVRAEDCSLHYMQAGIPYGSLERVNYDTVCNLVSRFLRRQITYKELREEFWGAVEGPRTS